ncbi:MAG: phage terminase large subunit [Anaplasmataceae bacterium]|nr:phage terminase large subunit [Anaplasmataceae bacterium]
MLSNKTILGYIDNIFSLTKESKITLNQERHYYPPPTVAKFMASKAEIRGLLGAMGSGKSSGCCAELLRLMSIQPKSPDGKRYSRWVVIRDTYTNITKTTLKTWMYWAGGNGEYQEGKNTYVIKNSELDVEIYFIPLNIAKDENRLKSFEVTGAWVNEAKEIKEEFINILIDRIGRYNPPDIISDNSYLIMDTNPCNIDHWWYRRFELRENVGEDNWEIFRQPSGRSPQAENLKYLKKGYYNRMEENHTEEYCKIYADGQYGFLAKGDPVYPKFNYNTHVEDYSLEDKDKKFYSNTYSMSNVIVGCDAGLTPASVYLMRDRLKGIWIVFDEIVLKDESCDAMGEQMLIREKYLLDKFEFCNERYFLDPAGNQRKDTDANTVLRLYRAKGLKAYLAGSSNALAKRREGLRHLIDNGKLKVLRNCRKTIEGLSGGYHYKEPNHYNEDNTKVVKNEYSHVIEALEYAILGARLFEEHILYHKKDNREFDRIMQSLAGRVD